MNPTPRSVLLSFFVATVSLAIAQPQTASPAPYTPKQSDRPEAMDGDEPGFQAIFDGKTLAGWEGNATYWRVENGSLVGEVTPQTLIKSNTFIIWRGGRPKDFELKLEYRITGDGNSGINYRSSVTPDSVTKDNPFAMRGYQCDIDGRNQYTGNNYEEKGRLFLAVRGQMTHVVGGRPPILFSAIGKQGDLGAVITNEWNAVHLIIRGNVLIHTINGQIMSVVIDDDVPNRPTDGLVGVQVHVGPPMKVEYRNIRLKNLPSDTP
jgi:hypothetical protein